VVARFISAMAENTRKLQSKGYYPLTFSSILAILTLVKMVQKKAKSKG
jgi:F0F1-type ATP synthase membrane subunit c/vacuolar-type H+-ATPase subunit K